MFEECLMWSDWRGKKDVCEPCISWWPLRHLWGDSKQEVLFWAGAGGRQAENESRSQSCSVLFFFSQGRVSICYAQPAWYPNVPSECDKNINLTWPGDANCRPSSCRQHTVFVYIYLAFPSILSLSVLQSKLFIHLVSKPLGQLPPPARDSKYSPASKDVMSDIHKGRCKKDRVKRQKNAVLHKRTIGKHNSEKLYGTRESTKEVVQRDRNRKKQQLMPVWYLVPAEKNPMYVCQQEKAVFRRFSRKNWVLSYISTKNYVYLISAGYTLL